MPITPEHRLYERSQSELATAIDIINRRLATEASERGWCSSYEAWLMRTNDEIGFEALKPSTREVSVVVTFTVPRGWSHEGLSEDIRAAVLRHAGQFPLDEVDVALDVDTLLAEVVR